MCGFENLKIRKMNIEFQAPGIYPPKLQVFAEAFKNAGGTEEGQIRKWEWLFAEYQGDLREIF